MTIKVNGMTISVENTNSVNMDMDIEKEVNSIESMSANINKSVEALNIVSNIKAVESFGYKSTEAVGEKIKSGIKNIGRSIVDFIDKLITTITEFIRKKVIETKINLTEKKLNSLKDKGCTKVVICPDKWNNFITKRDKVKETLLDLNNITDPVYKKLLAELKRLLLQITKNANYAMTVLDMEADTPVSIGEFEKWLTDAKLQVSDILQAVDMIRSSAVKVRKDIKQTLDDGGDKALISEANAFINFCGKVFALIISYVDATTDFSGFSNTSSK